MNKTTWRDELGAGINAARQGVAAVPPPEPPSPVKVISHAPTPDGHCNLCQRHLNSYAKIKGRLIRLSATESVDPGTGQRIVICRACHAFSNSMLFSDISEAREYVETMWTASGPSVAYTPVARFGEYQ